MNPWSDRGAEPLKVKECLRVFLGLVAVALLGVWTRLEVPEEIYDAEPATFQQLARFADPSLSEGVPAFARHPLPEAVGQALVGHGVVGPRTALTLVAVLGGLLGGLCIWAVLRGLCGRPLAAFAAAAIVMIQPWRTTLATDPSIAWLAGPALALGGVAWLSRTASLRAAAVAGAGLALCGWTAFSQLVTAGFGCLVLLAAHVPLMRRPFPEGPPVRPKRLLIALGVALAVAAAALAPAALQGMPDGAPLTGSQADGWLGGDGTMQLLGVQIGADGHHYYWPVMIGWLVFSVLVWVALNVRDPRLRPWWFALLAGFLLLQGQKLHVVGYELEYVVLPYAWFSSLPGFVQLPGPAAWLPLFGVAMAAVLALGLREWQIQHGRAATFLLAAFTALELRPEPAEPATQLPPVVYKQMVDEGGAGAVLELPLAPMNAVGLWNARSHGRPVAFLDRLTGAADEGLPPPPGLLEFLSPADSGDAAPGDAERELAAISPARLDSWRDWLEEQAQVRWVVLRHALEIRAGAPIATGRIRWHQRIKHELTPWSFNGWLHDERENRRRDLSQEFRSQAEGLARVRLLFERWYGAADSRLGGAYTFVWQVRAKSEEPRSEPPAAVPAEAAARREPSAPAGAIGDGR